MSVDVKGSSGTPEDAASGGHLENESSLNAASGDSKQTDEVVSRSTYLKTLGELKSIKGKFGEMQSQLEELTQTKLAQEGNKDQLIETLRTQIEKERKQKEMLAGNFAQRSLRAQFEAEAMRQGIKKPQIMDKLIDYTAYVSSLDTETFTADETDVKSTVEQVKQEYPELFSKSSPNVNTGTPSVDAKDIEQKAVDFNKLSRAEIDKMVEEIDRKEGKRANFVTG